MTEQQTLEKRIRDKIAEIPISAGGYMALYQEHLRDTLSGSLLDQIARIAAEEANKGASAREVLGVTNGRE